MVSPSEVDALLNRLIPSLPAEDCPLLAAEGRILRAPLAADRDLPPYDRATLDGFACASATLLRGQRSLRIAGMQAAGTLRQTLAEPLESCLEIATGATLPEGCDVVIPYEDTVREGAVMRLREGVTPHSGAAIHFQGTDARQGQVLLHPGVRLGGREIAVAASIGASHVRVAVSPSIAIVATGDELVEVENPSPAPHQVRRSNDFALRAALLAAGFTRVERLHLRDLKYELEHQLRRLIAEFDFILLTGGVSKGKYDFLPVVLEELRVERKVHGVSQRPGKPFWFGLTPRQTPVFALPGNPVSTYTCFHRYALPALRRMCGEVVSPPLTVPLAESFPFGAPLTPLIPVHLRVDAEGRLQATPAPTRTSGDFVGLLGTDGFLELPAGPGPFAAGTLGRFYPWSARSWGH